MTGATTTVAAPNADAEATKKYVDDLILGHTHGQRISPANIGAGNVDGNEFGYLNGVTSAIQTQLDGKQATLSAGTGITISAGGEVACTVTDTQLTDAQIGALGYIKTDTNTTYTAGTDY